MTDTRRGNRARSFFPVKPHDFEFHLLIFYVLVLPRDWGYMLHFVCFHASCEAWHPCSMNECHLTNQPIPRGAMTILSTWKLGTPLAVNSGVDSAAATISSVSLRCSPPL